MPKVTHWLVTIPSRFYLSVRPRFSWANLMVAGQPGVCPVSARRQCHLLSDLLIHLRVAVLLATLLAPGFARAASVRIRLETTDLNFNVVSSVNVGDQFLLRGFVTDLRANAQGVFSSYIDLAYSPAASVAVTGTVSFIAPFTFGSSEYQLTPGLITRLGAVSSILSSPGSGEKPQFNVRFQASAPGLVSFASNPTEGLAYSILLLGRNSPVPTNELEFVNTSIAVRGTELRISGIEFGTNGADLRITGPQNLAIQVQAITNLTNTVWQTLGSTVLLGNPGTARFRNPDATNHPIRFYRAYQP